jgi:hypothetical protein
MAKELFVYSPYKSKFKEQVSSGAVDDSQIGIIAETGELWVKGTYLPIVDLSNKADISKGVIEADGFKDGTDTTFFTPNRGIDPANTLATQKYVNEATTNFANDLTGVIEATPEEFTYRPSAGDKSIRDASAVIRKIKGNTIVARYADNTSEVLPMRTIGIETIGFNQWDEQWELGALATNTGGPVANQERGRSVNFFNVIPNATYYCATIAPTTTNSSGIVGSMSVLWYDSNQNFIKYEDITNWTRVAPSNARYAKICTWGGDVNTIFNSGVNINLSHSGVRDGEYEPYKKNILLLPEIYKYFPDGMNGNANVWDEINAEKAIKRWEVVDLGSLTWVKGGTGTSGVYRWLGKGIEHLAVKTVTASDIPNIVCAKYISSSASNIWATTMPMQVSLDSSGNVLIYDSEYNTSSTTIADFTAHLQGVLLYYELAEPIETPITEAIQLDYVVDDFGTEKAVAFGNSAPFRADIVYQFNAEGRIRDNSRNIERVESTITTRLIPSQTAMLGLPNKVMTWDGNKTLMSLPIAEDIDHWDLKESSWGTIPTSQQVREYIKSITDKLIPSQSATLESSNRVMMWNGDYAMTSLPIAANFAQWEAGAIPTGQQVMDYISAIKGSLATGLTPKETLTIGASGYDIIDPNKVYEITTKSSTTYNYDLYLSTTEGVDVAADNEWRIRIDTRNGFSGRIGIKPVEVELREYKMRWAYPETGSGTAPTIKADFIYDIQFRMIGNTLLGTYKKY